MKAPAFQFYPRDFLVGTALFSNEQKGIYVTLLCYQWDHGRLPSDVKKLSRLAGCSVSKFNGVLSKFKDDGEGHIYNERLENERLKQDKYRDGQSENGKKGGRPIKSEAKAKQKASHKPIITRAKPLQSASASAETIPPIPEEGFLIFWASYPKRKNRQKAEAAWFKIKDWQNLLPTMLSVIAREKATEQWTKQKGQFIPYPASWLNGRMWEDEAEPVLELQTSINANDVDGYENCQ